ncbi:MAG: hypothetical protein AMJ54_14505 [Deltaproteobacteria bacterium SG8_13]|nr:MAG: hypothetical protein AMJ54_14505 [Deltaproteobacteria bacterium SG8_13]
MNTDALKTDIRTVFPNAEIGRVYFARQNIFLEEQYGFTPENTRFAEGGCCDEINEPECRFMQSYWGERFKFGGLAGYCHGGRSGLNAVSHHVPEVEGRKNLLLVTGPHIGYHQGQWGRIPRPGQPDITASCGSLCAVLQAGCESIRKKPEDPLDLQQHFVEQIMLPFLEKCSRSSQPPDIVEATRFLMEKIDSDLFAIIGDLEGGFNGQIAVITGITINTETGNFFEVSRFEVRGSNR